MGRYGCKMCGEGTAREGDSEKDSTGGKEMDISRRNFLKAGAVASALGLGGAALAGCGSPSSSKEEKAATA